MNTKEAIMDSIIYKDSLKLLHTCSNGKRFAILDILPVPAKEIEYLLDMTPPTANKHIRELMFVGVIKRDRAGGDIYLTHLGEIFMKKFVELRQGMKEELMRGARVNDKKTRCG